MKTLTFKRMILLVIEFIVSGLISTIIQFNLTTEKIKNINMKTIIDNAIIYGMIFITIFIIFQITYWYVKSLNNFIRQQSVINKFNSIMIIRFEENYKSHICQVLEYDSELFTNEELIYLTKYLNDKNFLKIQMKGRNNVFGNPC